MIIEEKWIDKKINKLPPTRSSVSWTITAGGVGTVPESVEWNNSKLLLLPRARGFFSVYMRQRAFAQMKTLFQYRLDQDRMKVDSGNRARGSQDNLNKRESPGLAIYKLF